MEREDQDLRVGYRQQKGENAIAMNNDEYEAVRSLFFLTSLIYP